MKFKPSKMYIFEIECASFIVAQSTADVTVSPGRYGFLFFKPELLRDTMKGKHSINPVTAVDGNFLTKSLYRGT